VGDSLGFDGGRVLAARLDLVASYCLLPEIGKLSEVSC
jgi:hypothetical protein